MDREKIEIFVRKNWIGLVILAVGFASFSFVGIKAITKFSGPDDSAVQVSKQDIKNFKSNNTRNTTTVRKAAPPKYKRNTDIKESNIAGAWQADLENAKMLLQLKSGQYKMVIVPGGGTTRFYSNGTYALKEDILLFKPDISIPAPKSQVSSYAFLTRSPFPVMVTRNRGNLVFQRPVAEANIYVPNSHPILNKTKNDLVVFDVLK